MDENGGKWFVDSGTAADAFGPRSYRNHEDGFVYDERPEGHVVRLVSPKGREFFYPTIFDTPEKADEFAAEFDAYLRKGGQPDLSEWEFHRVQYGSPAYQEEEPYIVDLERRRDLEGLDMWIPMGGAYHEC